MERSLWYDVKSGCAGLVGAALGVLVFDPDHPQLVLVSSATAVVAIAILDVVRRVMLHRKR